MYDYGKLVYLDNQKTGSTYVSHFLSNCCILEHVKSRKHYAVKRDYRPGSVYFSTVRHPVDLYISLYQYGCEQRGGTYKKIRKLGRLDLYESLPAWLDFVLDPQNAEVFSTGYAHVAGLGVGLMSFRSMHITLRHRVSNRHSRLRTSVVRSFKKAMGRAVRPQAVVMQSAKTYEDLIKMWTENTIAAHVFHQEQLNDSLLIFATQTVPDFFDQAAVRAFLDTSERINTSRPRESVEIPEDIYQLILTKERFLLDRFYVGQPHATHVIRT